MVENGPRGLIIDETSDLTNLSKSPKNSNSGINTDTNTENNAENNAVNNSKNSKNVVKNSGKNSKKKVSLLGGLSTIVDLTTGKPVVLRQGKGFIDVDSIST